MRILLKNILSIQGEMAESSGAFQKGLRTQQYSSNGKVNTQKQQDFDETVYFFRHLDVKKYEIQ